MAKRAGWCALLALLLALAGCEKKPAAAPMADAQPSDVQFLADNAVWRSQRSAELLEPEGWTSLVGLHWLELKAHYIGRGPGSGIRLEVGPPKLGLVQQDGEHVYFTPEPGLALSVDGQPLKERIELKTGSEPTVVHFDDGKGALSAIKRGQRFALRLKHADAATRTGFAGLDYWPADPTWRIRAQFVPHPPGHTLPIVDIVGTEVAAPNPGAVEFERDGRTYRLEAMGEPDKSLFLILADRTSGHGSYPAGRYIDTAPVSVDGSVIVNFNQAYNPPCAFTPFATCPLPPPENRLDLAVTAGEKLYAGAPAHTIP